MTITVTNQDGSTIDFDDDTPQSTIQLASKRYAVMHGTADTMGGGLMDTLFNNNPGGRILKAIGLGAEAGWGTSGFRWGPNAEVEKQLKDLGVFNDYEKDEHTLYKSAVEAIARPLSLAVQDVFQGPTAVISGLAAGARQAGVEVGLPGVGEFIGAAPEFLGGMAGVHLEVPPLIRQAVRSRVVGPDSEPNPATPPVSPAERDFHSEATQPELPGFAGLPLAQQPDPTAPPAPTTVVPTPPSGDAGLPPPGTFVAPLGEGGQGELVLQPPGQPRAPITITAPSDFTPPVEEPPPYNPPTRHVDDQGNFQFDTINSGNDVDRAIKEFMAPSMGEEPTPAKVEDLADAVGVNPEEIMGRDHGTTEEVDAKIKLLTGSATEIHDAAGAARDDPANLEATIKLAEALDRHMMIQARILGDKNVPSLAEAIKPPEPLPIPRAPKAPEPLPIPEAPKAPEAIPVPRVGEEKAAELTAEQKAATEMTQSIGNGVAAMDNPKQVSVFLQGVMNFIRDDFAKLKPEEMTLAGVWGKLRDSLIELWTSGLISGVGTHIPYMVGQLFMSFVHAADVAAGAVVGQVLRPFGGERIPFGAAPTGLAYAIFKGTPEGIIMSGKAARSGLTPIVAGEREAPFLLAHPPTIPALLGGGVIRLPTRMTNMIHSFSRGILSAQTRAELAYAEAAKTTTPGTPAFFAKLQNVLDNMPYELLAKSVKETNDISLMGKGGPFLQEMSSWTSKWPSLKFIIPFAQMSGKAFRQSILEHTPAGFFFNKEIHDNLMGRNGNLARDLQYGKLLVGAGIAYAITSYLMQGKMTGGGSPDYKEESLDQMIGRPKYTIQIGNTSYGYGNFGQIGLLLSTIADGYEIAHALSDKENDHVGQLILSSISHLLVDENWIRTPAQLVQAIEDGMNNKPETWYRFWRSQAASMIPFSGQLRQAAANMDPYMREARTLLDAYKRNLPWARQSLYPVYDIFGQPVPSPTSDTVGLAGVRAYQLNNDPVLLAMKRLQVFPGPVSRYMRMGKIGVELTDQQHADYARIAGRIMKLRLDAIVNAPSFEQLTPYIQHKMIETTVERSRRSAERQIKLAYPHIMEQAVAVREAEHGGALPPRKPVQQPEEEE